jgi:transposase
MTKKKQSTEAAVREIRRRTRRKFAPEEKVRIVLEGLRGEQSVSELCRREGIAANLYYRWSKDFLEAGKKQLAGDTVREATSDEVKDLRAENHELKEVVADVTLDNRVLKKKSDGTWRGGRYVRRTGFREARDHSLGRRNGSAGAGHAEAPGRAKEHVLRLVSALPRGWLRRLGR